MNKFNRTRYGNGDEDAAAPVAFNALNSHPKGEAHAGLIAALVLAGEHSPDL